MHDNYFIPVNGEVYTESSFPASHWYRYLQVFERIIVLGRKKCPETEKDINCLQKTSTTGVSFVFAPNLSSPQAQILRRHKVKGIAGNLMQKVEAVIVRLPSELGLIAIGEAKRRGVPWAVELAGCPWDGLWNYGSWQGKLYAPVMMWRTKMALASAPYAIYVTQHFLQSRYPNKKGVIESCSNVEIPQPDEEVLKQRIAGIDNQDMWVILGLIGTLKTRYKGIQTIFKALGTVRQKLPHLQFRILGEGDSEPWRKEAQLYGVEDIVAFDGTLPSGSPVLNWLDNVDIYLQPSLKEGLPRALIEAMSRACPALGSFCAGIPELLDRECMVKPGDAQDLGKKISRAVRDLDWQKTQALCNWRVARKYSQELLQKKRFYFWSQFANYARVQNKKTKHD